MFSGVLTKSAEKSTDVHALEGIRSALPQAPVGLTAAFDSAPYMDVFSRVVSLFLANFQLEMPTRWVRLITHA